MDVIFKNNFTLDSVLQIHGLIRSANYIIYSLSLQGQYELYGDIYLHYFLFCSHSFTSYYPLLDP